MPIMHLIIRDYECLNRVVPEMHKGELDQDFCYNKSLVAITFWLINSATDPDSRENFHGQIVLVEARYMNERRAVQKFDLIVAEYQKIVFAKFAQHSVDVDWRQPQRIGKFALRQRAEKAVFIAGSVDPGPVAQFEQKVGNAYKRTPTADADEMLNQDGSLPCHQFHKCHGEAGRFEQAFGKMVQRNF